MLDRDTGVGLIASATVLAGLLGYAMDWAFSFLPV
jgi:hypothetical protein